MSRQSPANARGFTYVEVLVSGALLAMVLLALCTVLVTGYAGVATSGKSTVGVAAARQLVESAQRLPFDSIAQLDGFDTDDPSSQPASGPEREVARRWRYALAGEGVGWSFTSAETERWTGITQGEGPLGARGTITVTARGASLWEIGVAVNVPGRFKPVAFRTYRARLS